MLLISESKEPNASLGLNEAYSVKTPEDIKRLYAKWAATYESEFVDKEKYRYPKAIAQIFVTVGNNVKIESVLDVGTGTGLTGTYLTSHFPQMKIDGIDISPEMLEEARKKIRENGRTVYTHLFERDLSEPIDLQNSAYDALICSGTFTHGHLGPGALDNLIPLIRSGGLFVIGVNNEHFVEKDFDSKLRQLVHDGVITHLEIHMIDVYESGSSHFGDQARVLVFERV